MELKILWASMYGNAEYVAARVETMANKKDFNVEMIEMNDVSMADLQKMKNVAVVTSTTGQGDVPTNGEWFWDDLEKADIDLSNMRYSVCALGDSSHAEFCGAGKKIDIRLAELGARKVVSRVECDGDDTGSHQWADDFLNKLAEA